MQQSSTYPGRADAAEAIREHLVCLRGGAPFLSPTDTDVLSSWLEEGYSVPAVIQALEKVAQARQKRPTKAPFTLAKAKRYLKADDRSAAPGAVGAPTLTAFVREFLASTRGDPRRAALETLGNELLDLPGDDPCQLQERALRLFREFHEKAWASLSDSERAQRLTRAREDLGDLADLLGPAALSASIEERARSALRRAYPSLTATALQQALFP